MDFPTELKRRVARIEAGIRQLVPPPDTRPRRLHEAMRYSLEAGGKRMRPVLVLASAELFDRNGAAPPPHTTAAAPSPLPAAVAIECVHTYSLIHDDLPCMDNDDLRRGRPTAHKAFDEATALLAGDALLTHAFALLATSYADRPALAASLVAELGIAAGSRRLIGGQMEDLLAERKAGPAVDVLEFIHPNKTAAMIEAALAMGAMVAGAADGEVDLMRQAGRHLGIAFQVIDDVLDATSDSATLGKTAGKDAKAGKATAVALHGVVGAREIAERETRSALAALNRLPGDTSFLAALFGTMAARTN